MHIRVMTTYQLRNLFNAEWGEHVFTEQGAKNMSKEDSCPFSCSFRVLCLGLLNSKINRTQEAS
jgi:hypothetical protein